MKRRLAVGIVCCLLLPTRTRAQNVASDTAPPPVMREMRGAWIATVGNIDWPSRTGLSSDEQQRELIAILDRLVELKMNAAIFQVRPAADALYASRLEPWSEFLSGEMGRAPSPYYDPLEFAVTEAHKRGLELHAWINPYRARYSTVRPASKSHITRANPRLVRNYGSYVWMDPGDAAVRARTKRVVLDIVKRYDVDGIHLDDYFYPYPESREGREIPFPDDATWKRYQRRGGKLSRGDWRRHNVDLLVSELYRGVHAVKPWVRFGVSPFGIWRPGYPASVSGLDQYSALYADARKWWNEGWVDYLVPQLYWSLDRPQQSYVELLHWWSAENLHHRNLWAGNYTGKVGFTTSAKWSVSEVIEQIRRTRGEAGASGNVHFSMKVFMADPDMLNEQLLREVYGAPALPPASGWLDDQTPGSPRLIPRVDEATGERLVEITAPVRVRKDTHAAAPRLWVVQARSDDGWTTAILPATTRFYSLRPRTTDVRVRAVDRVGHLGPDARIALPR